MGELTWKITLDGEDITGGTSPNNEFSYDGFTKNTGTTDLVYLIEVSDTSGHSGSIEYVLKACPQKCYEVHAGAGATHACWKHTVAFEAIEIDCGEIPEFNCDGFELSANTIIPYNGGNHSDSVVLATFVPFECQKDDGYYTVSADTDWISDGEVVKTSPELYSVKGYVDYNNTISRRTATIEVTYHDTISTANTCTSSCMVTQEAAPKKINVKLTKGMGFSGNTSMLRFTKIVIIVEANDSFSIDNLNLRFSELLDSYTEIDLSSYNDIPFNEKITLICLYDNKVDENDVYYRELVIGWYPDGRQMSEIILVPDGQYNITVRGNDIEPFIPPNQQELVEEP